jgi:hypothetical protein
MAGLDPLFGFTAQVAGFFKLEWASTAASLKLRAVFALCFNVFSVSDS